MLKRANDLWVSVMKWLATLNPNLFVMGSNQISRLFCDTFFFNSSFVILSLSPFFLLFFFSFSALFFLYFVFIVSKFISNFKSKNTKWISNFPSCVCLRIYYFTVYFPFAGCICLRVSVPEPFETNMMVEFRRLLRCPGCLSARLYRTFAKCMINRKQVLLGLPKGSNQRYPPSFPKPPYSLNHLILVVDFLCRSILIASYYK